MLKLAQKFQQHSTYKQCIHTGGKTKKEHPWYTMITDLFHKISTVREIQNIPVLYMLHNITVHTSKEA